MPVVLLCTLLASVLMSWENWDYSFSGTLSRYQQAPLAVVHSTGPLTLSSHQEKCFCDVLLESGQDLRDVVE